MNTHFNPIVSKLNSLPFTEAIKLLKTRRDWLVQEAPASPWYWWLSSMAWVHGLADVGYSPGSFTTYVTGDVGTLVIQRQTLMDLAEKLVQKELAGKSIVKRWIQIWAKQDRDFRRTAQAIRETKLSALAEPKLMELFRQFCRLYYEVETLPLSNEFLIPYTDKLLKRLVAERPDHAGALSELITPKKKSFIQQEEEELLRIKKLAPSARTAALKAHAAKWYFLHGGYDGPKPQSVAEFKQKMVKLRLTSFRRKRQKQIQLDKKTATTLRLTRLVAGWKDDRKKDNLIGSVILDLFAREFSRRYRIPYKLIRYAIPREWQKLASKDKSFILELRLRKRSGTGWAILFTRCSDVFTGRCYKQIKDLVQMQKQSSDTLEGVIANPGKVTGTVRIIHHPQKETFKQGSILVTSMTRPEFAPLMKKAKAILCDEGGLLSHAAIISRELNIPCIVGLGHAMATLKDGDMVEVDANKGIVLKLN